MPGIYIPEPYPDEMDQARDYMIKRDEERAMASVGKMIRRISGLLGTKDVTPWEERFITDMVERSGNGQNTTRLSGNQVEKIEQLFNKHYGDGA